MEDDFTEEDQQAMAELETTDNEIAEGSEAEKEQDTGPEKEQEQEQEQEQEKDDEKEKSQFSPEEFQKLQTNYENLSRALNEERTMRKEFRSKLEEKDTLMQRMEERFQKIQERFQKEEIPDPEENPVGHLLYQQDQLRKRLDEFDNRAKTQDRSSEQQNYISTIQTQMETLESQFHQAHPDYYDAVKYMRAIRDRDYTAIGITDPVERAQMVNNDAFYIVQNALAKNQNAAEVIYNIARNYGYAAQSMESMDNKTKIETQKKAVEQSKSLGSKGSTATGPSLRQLSNMTDDEFAALSDDDWERMWTQ